MIRHVIRGRIGEHEVADRSLSGGASMTWLGKTRRERTLSSRYAGHEGSPVTPNFKIVGF
jgi:hypothetical protein